MLDQVLHVLVGKVNVQQQAFYMYDSLVEAVSFNIGTVGSVTTHML